jgi:muramoyltetrapeptide carboxypeptidase LdcA involved in peptidoglycan recycling
MFDLHFFGGLEMRYPDFLEKNGTIGFVAPSFGCATEPYISAFDSAVEYFRNDGKNVQFGCNVYEDSGIGISSSPQNCGRELTDMYCDDTNDCLISVGGGELMCEILEYVDFHKIGQAKPKWFCGYSDNANFTFLNTTINDVASIYAPCAGAFGMKPLHRCMEDYRRLLTGELDYCEGISDGALSGGTALCENDRYIRFDGYEKWEKESLKSPENPLATINATEKSEVKVYAWDEDGEIQTTDGNVKFKGRLIGGCMDILVNLLGTKFDKVNDFIKCYEDDGFIWFLESCDLNVFAIRRAMWQMDNAGWFKNVKGFVIGRPLCMGQEMMGLDQYEAVLGIVGKYNVPVVMDIDIGHISPSMPVVCGSIGEVEAGNGKYSMTYHFI